MRAETSELMKALIEAPISHYQVGVVVQMLIGIRCEPAAPANPSIMEGCYRDRGEPRIGIPSNVKASSPRQVPRVSPTVIPLHHPCRTPWEVENLRIA